MKNLLISSLLLLWGCSIFGQELPLAAKEKIMQLKGAEFCGTTSPSAKDIQATEAFVKSFQSDARNLRIAADPIYIPIKVHVVVNDAGDLPDLSFFNPKSFNESLASTNAIFKSVNIDKGH